MTNSIKMLAGVLLVGTALTLAPLSAFAQDAATPATTAPAAPVDPTAVVATVGDDTVTEADINFAAEDLQQELAQVPAEQRRPFLVSVLIDMKVMAKAARAAGMDKDPDYMRRLTYLEDRTLRREYFGAKIATAVTADTLKAAYDKYVADFKPVQQLHARHILVATEEEAKAVKADLDAGKPFEVEAMAKTTDPSGKTNGGDLGFFEKGQMVPEFETAAEALQPGQISDPVKSQFGWHIIKLEEKRMSAPEPIAQMQQQLAQQAMFAAYDAAMAGFKKDTPVNIPDAALAAAVKAQSEPAADETPAQ